MNQHTLLQKLHIGDESTTKMVYLTIKKKFIPWIQQYGCPANEAVDWLHLSFATLLENIRSGKLTELSSSIDTYCMSIGKNQYLAAQRRSQRTQQAVEEYTYGLDENDYAHREKIAQQLKQVTHAMQQLGASCQRLLTAFYHYQQSMEEIANEMNYTSAANARNQKYKCMKRLRKLVVT